jgi:hypothetical protein
MLATEINLKQGPYRGHALRMKVSRFEQFEIWQLNGKEWEMLAYFQDLDVASAMAKPRSNPIQLKRVKYDEGKLVEEEVLAEMGAMRADE